MINFCIERPFGFPTIIVKQLLGSNIYCQAQKYMHLLTLTICAIVNKMLTSIWIIVNMLGFNIYCQAEQYVHFAPSYWLWGGWTGWNEQKANIQRKRSQDTYQ